MTTINTDIWAGKLGLEARSPSVSKTIKVSVGVDCMSSEDMISF